MIDVSIVGGSGLVIDQAKSPLPNKNVNLFYGFNPPMVASCIRDTLRFLFETGAPDRLKYNSDPKKSAIAIDLSFDDNQEEAIMKRPKITINRGPYSLSAVGITDSATDSTFATSTGNSRKDSFLNMVNGSCSIRVTAYSLGTCEELAYLVSTFLVWSRPLLCNTLGFKNIASPLSSSPIMLDNDDKAKYVIELNVPYVTEMQWSSEDLGVRLKGFLIEQVAEDN